MSLFLNLQKIPGITSTEKQLVDYIITHPNTVVNMSMEEFAKETFSSRSTIARFCNKCGFEGWRQLKTQLVIDLNLYLKERAESNTLLPIVKEDTAQEVVDKVTSTSMLSLMETGRVNNVEALVRVAKRITEARKIYVFGAGYSAAVASDFRMRLCALRLPIVTYNNIYEFKMKMKDAGSEDVALLISYTGRSAETLEVADFLYRYRVHRVSITSNSPNPLTEKSETQLYVNAADALTSINREK